MPASRLIKNAEKKNKPAALQMEQGTMQLHQVVFEYLIIYGLLCL